MTDRLAKPNGVGAIKIVRRTLADGSVKEYRYSRKKIGQRRPPGALKGIFNDYSQSPDFKRLSPGWQKAKLWHMRLVEDEIGWMSLEELQDRSARAEFYEMRDRHAHKANRADKMVQALSSILEWAYDRGRIDVNHARRIEMLVNPMLSPHRDKCYSAEQEETILADGNILAALRRLYLVALYTGLRRADLCALQGQNLDKDGWLTVTPKKTVRTTGVTIHLPVFALPPLVRVLKGAPSKGPLLLTETGLEWTHFNVSHRWRLAMLKLGYGGMRFHDIRHTTATRLVEAGCTEAERGAVLGHALADGAGKVYVARTRALSLNAYEKWARWMENGAEVVNLENARRKTGKFER